MKANRFVEQFGWDAAKEALTLACDKLEHVNYENHAVLIIDLKRLVESHELVERLGGIETMRIMQKQMVLNSLKDGMNISFDGEFVGTFSFDQLEQAILDVESCQ